MNLKTGIWYKVEDDEYYPYEFVLFLFLIKKKENTWQVIDAWSNSTHPQLQLHFDEKTDAFFADRKEFVEQAPNIVNLEEKMIELTFESNK